MAGPTGKIVKHLRKAVLLQEGKEMTDGQLLESFLSKQDEAAFATLLRRHGPMVWGVCRRVLRNHHDAEDAFQASFLVLARKAESIAPKEMLPNWLFGVAYRAALKARALAARRHEREKQVTEMPEPGFMPKDLWPDLRPLLDRELSRLPDKYRVVIVLCDLEGKTRNEAARQLRVPEGTIAGWLARARTKLASRLARHGLALSSGTLATILSREAASGSVPPALELATCQVAQLCMAGTSVGLMPKTVVALTEEVLKAMMLTRLKIGMSLLLVAAVLGIGGALITHSVHAQRQAEVAGDDLGEEKNPKADQDAPPLEAEEPTERASFEGHSAQVTSVAFSPNGEIVASGGNEGAVKLWDVATGKERASLKGYPSAAFSPDGKTLATGSMDHTVKLWEVATGKELAALQGHSYCVLSVAFSPDGKTLASGSGDSGRGDQTVKLWDVATGKERTSLKGYTKGVSSVAFSPDGKILASGSPGGGDYTVRLWDVATGKERACFPGHVFSVAFSPDGKTLASGSAENTVTLWDLATGELRIALRGHKETVRSVAFSPDGKTLASGSDDQTVKLWEVATGKERAWFQEHTRSVFSVAFSPDGKTLATARDDKIVKLSEVFALPKADDRRLKDAWQDMASDNGMTAFKAMKTLIQRGNRTVAFLKGELRPVPMPGEQVAQFIKDLDSDQFVIRQKATEGLEKFGEVAAPALKKKLATNPSLETRQRIERLLDKVAKNVLRPEVMQALRAVEVLEHIGTPEARQLLGSLAAGAEMAMPTEEAKMALDRMRPK